MEEETVPPNWSDLVTHSSELATNHDYNMAEVWLVESTNSPTGVPTDHPVVDPFAIVPGQHVSNSTKRGKRTWS